MKNRKLMTMSLLSLGALAVAGSAFALSSKGSLRRVDAEPENYTLTIDKDTLIWDHGSTFHVLTSKGSQFSVGATNAGDGVGDYFVLMSNNGSGIYSNSPIQTVIDVTFTLDSDAANVRCYFSDSAGSYTGADVVVTSGVTFFPPAGHEKDVYINTWFSGANVYIKSIVIHYSCV